MGNNSSNINTINYEDMQKIIESDDYLLINTLPLNEQYCLIYNTVNINEEETTINSLMNNYIDKNIVIYGKNYNDITLLKKYNQLISFGFTNIYIYKGGLFEWLLLNDIYGSENFKIIGNELDILKYRNPAIIKM
jgi:hypothetical protein